MCVGVGCVCVCGCVSVCVIGKHLSVLDSFCDPTHCEGREKGGGGGAARERRSI